jgi:uncharacterized cupredoxin-like copper-binding protein
MTGDDACTVTFDVAQWAVTPGQYVVFCNITGHYSQGMYSGLTVS